MNRLLYPRIYLIEHNRVATYARDYGAAKTVGTFTLLPGEKTNISIRSYSKKEITKAKSENVLDSFSNNSANTLEHILQSEVQTKTGDESSNTNANNATSTSANTSMNQNTSGQTGQWEAGGGLSLNLFGCLQLGGGGGGGNSNTSSNTSGSQTTSGSSSGAEHISTLNSVREQFNNTV